MAERKERKDSEVQVLIDTVQSLTESASAVGVNECTPTDRVKQNYGLKMMKVNDVSTSISQRRISLSRKQCRK